MNLKPPHVRHKKLKKLKPSLWTAIDKRSEKQGTLENPGAGGYEYFLVDTTNGKEIEAK